MRIMCDTRCVSVCHCSRLQIALLRDINAESSSRFMVFFLEKQQWLPVVSKRSEIPATIDVNSGLLLVLNVLLS